MATNEGKSGAGGIEVRLAIFLFSVPLLKPLPGLCGLSAVHPVGGDSLVWLQREWAPSQDALDQSKRGDHQVVGQYENHVGSDPADKVGRPQPGPLAAR